MKDQRKIMLGAICLLWIIVFINMNMVEQTNAWKNHPPSSPEEIPYRPEDFNFIGKSSGTYKKTHYGTHDWIADAALRILYEFDKREDWEWLMHNLNDKNPIWAEYGTQNTHNAVRSYISFLFATQMPDMKKSKAGEDTPFPRKNPLEIDLWKYEGEIISDNRNDLDLWVGQEHKQQYRWIPVHAEIQGNKYYIFITQKDSNHYYDAPTYALKMGKNAVRCLTHKETNQETKIKESWAKPETAACYLAIMSHYIADVSCPAHLLRPQDYYYLEQIDDEHKISVEHHVPPNAFHTSIEKQTGLHTIWDKYNGIPKGYYQSGEFFEIGLYEKISKSVNNIEAISPDRAVFLMAQKAIEISYGHINGKGYGNGYNKKGLYINTDIKNELGSYVVYDSNKRNENSPIVTDGLTFKEYFDMVEELLNWAVYYTACAMKWTLKEANKQNQGDFNPNNWAVIPFEDLHPEATPQKIPKNYKNWKDEHITDAHKQSWFYTQAGMLMTVAAIGSPILIIIYGPNILKTVIEKIKIKKEKY